MFAVLLVGSHSAVGEQLEPPLSANIGGADVYMLVAGATHGRKHVARCLGILGLVIASSLTTATSLCAAGPITLRISAAPPGSGHCVLVRFSLDSADNLVE